MTSQSGPLGPAAGRGGFTLLELLLVTVVLVAIIAISAPNFSPAFRLMALKQTAHDLAYLMRYAQSRAVTYNTTVRLEFAADYSAYWLTQKARKDLGPQSAGPAPEGSDPGSLGDAPAAQDSPARPQEGEDQQNEFLRVRGRYGKSFRVPEHIIIESEKPAVDFSPDGSIDKRLLSLCDGKYCFDVSTQERRGHVYVYGYEQES